MYHSTDAYCSYITWAKPHLLLFADNLGAVKILSPATRRTKVLAGFSNFFVSPDGEWVAGFAGLPPEEAETVGVVSLRTSRCLEVPHGANQTDESTGFTRDSKAVIVARQPFVPNNGPTGKAQLVQFALTSLRTSCPHWMIAR